MRIVLELTDKEIDFLRQASNQCDCAGGMDLWQSDEMEAFGKKIRLAIDSKFKMGDKITPRDEHHHYHGKIGIVTKTFDTGILIQFPDGKMIVDKAEQCRKVE